MTVASQDTCSSCRRDREDAGKLPRTLSRLPLEVTQDSTFKRKGVPIRLCAFCDGDALEDALRLHHLRSTS